ncbi:hypothetical protein AB9P05_04020 [Roseivirga sp. BDSF3-8]|uniref:hypothetical protein n=1 Tax=Roseivirga sp. BDSF3-8 TaxID=3241598 RepID=UPI0035326A52
MEFYMVKEGDEIVDHYIAFDGQFYQPYVYGPNSKVPAKQLEQKANELALSANQLERPADWDTNPNYKYGLIEEVPTKHDVPDLATPALTFYEKAMVPLRLMREILEQIQVHERWWNEDCGNGVDCATGNENELGIFIPDVIAAAGNILIDEGKDNGCDSQLGRDEIYLQPFQMEAYLITI